MKSALIFMSGSRGDHEPFFAMAAGMVQSGKFDRVHLSIQAEYMHLVPKDDRIIAHELPVTLAEIWKVYFFTLLKGTVLGWFTGRNDPISLQGDCMTAIINDVLIPKAMELHELVRKTQPCAVVSGVLLGPVVSLITRKLHLPMWVVNLQPNTPTAAYPFFFSSIPNALKASEEVAQMHKLGLEHKLQSENLDTYAAHVAVHTNTLDRVNSFCDALDLPRLQESDVFEMFSGKMDGVKILNAYPSQLIPPCVDWPSTVHQVPSLADGYIPSGWKPEDKCPKLVEYLSRVSEKPLVVNFGSMNIKKKGLVTREIFKALQEVGIKNVLLLKRGGDLGVHCLSWFDCDLKKWASEHVFVSEEAPQHAWLLPQCSAMICHGGAGTTCVGLRAGIPLVVSPFVYDQYFWGNLCQALGVGAVAGPCVEEAPAASFVRALNIALNDEVRENAKKMGESIREEGSAGILAAEIIASSC